MNIINSSKDGTVGVVSDVGDLKNVGDFSIRCLDDWMKKVKLVLGDDIDVLIEFKLCGNPTEPAYFITASHGGDDPKVMVCGKFRIDGKQWGDK
jgi:hypothetical protein